MSFASTCRSSLLRAIQEGEIDPVGSKRPVKVDIRIISATNRNLAELTQEGNFREDLFYRLNAFPIHIPPLRERQEDVTELAKHFVARFAAEENKPVSGFTDAAVMLLNSYSWPGNVRQLENSVFRAVVLCDSDVLDVVDFPQIAGAMGVPVKRIQAPDAQVESSANTSSSGRQIRADSPYAVSGTNAAGHMRKLEELEAEVIRMAINRYEGRMSEVARRLGIGRSTLYRKLKEFGLESENGRETEKDTPEAKRISA